METIFQSIEMLSKEKGIDSSIVLDAVKDALLLAAKKHFRTNEDYVAEMDPKSGAIKLYAVKKVVEEVMDAAHEMRLNEAVKFDSGGVCGRGRADSETDGCIWGEFPRKRPSR